MSIIKEGFIFVNEKGEYACLTDAIGHGPNRKEVRWYANVDYATVFTTKTPGHPVMGKHIRAALQDKQCLRATSTVVVSISTCDPKS